MLVIKMRIVYFTVASNVFRTIQQIQQFKAKVRIRKIFFNEYLEDVVRTRNSDLIFSLNQKINKRTENAMTTVLESIVARYLKLQSGEEMIASDKIRRCY